jgi:copper homeostasis protein
MNCKRIIVLAAGRGTRLQESASAPDLPAGITADNHHDAQHRAKALFRVAGQPLLLHLLQRADRAGFTEATIVCRPDERHMRAEVRSWNETPAGEKMRIGFAVQSNPEGTAHALQVALEQDQMLPADHFVLCNGDNVPNTATLRQLRARSGAAMVGFEPDGLMLPAERVRAFAVCGVDGEGDLARIIEKPTEEQLMQLADPLLVSMNLFKLPAGVALESCRTTTPHPVRGERELPLAIEKIVISEYPIVVMRVSAPVVDVTRLHDVPQAEEVLALDNRNMLFEVCASTPEDADVAAAGGADRLELCAHWPCGGLTPPDADVVLAAASGLPVHALIRPRAGHFVYSQREKEWMKDQTHHALTAGASRAVIGATHPDGRLDLPWLEDMAATYGGHRLVIHRAIDLTPDLDSDARALAALGISRVLTSGGVPRAIDGLARIATLVDLGFQVTAGSGVTPTDLPNFAAAGVEAIHASCRTPRPADLPLFDGTTHPVDPNKVAAFRRSLQACAASQL